MATETKLTKDEISVQEPMGYIIESAKKAEIEVNKLVKDLGLLLPLTEKIFSGGKPTTVNAIQLQEKALKKLNDEADRARKIEEQSTSQKIKLERLAQAEIRTKKLLNQEVEKEVRATEKLTRAQQRAESGYFKVQDAITSLSNRYRELAIRKELGETLSAKEERRLAGLEKAMLKYDGVIKKVDAQMGRHQRNVGNYGSAFNGLSFSMSQLTREAPAFANSMQTGFMAISNNLPIFFDEIQKIKIANKQLAADGKATTSVFRQIASGLFSFQTGLSIGVTLLTIYGAQIVDFFSNISGGSSIMSELNGAIKEQADYIGKEKAEIDTLLIVAKDKSRSDAERLKAIEAINTVNPEYINGITLENIETKKSREQIDLYIKSLDRKAKSMAIQQLKEKKYAEIMKLSLEGGGVSDAVSSFFSDPLRVYDIYLGSQEEKIKALNTGNKKILGLENDIKKLNKMIDIEDLSLKGLTGSDEKTNTSAGSGGKKTNSDKYKSIEEMYALRKKMILEEGNTTRQEIQMINDLDKWRLEEKINIEKATKGELITITNLEIELLELSKKTLENKESELYFLGEQLKIEKEIRKGIMSPEDLERQLKIGNDRNIIQADYNVLLKELEILNAQNKGGSTKEIAKLEKELIELKKQQIIEKLKFDKIEAEGNKQKIQMLEKQAEIELAKLDASKKQVDVQKELTNLAQETAKITEDYLTNVLENQIKAIDEQIAMVNKSYTLLEQKAANGNIKANESIKEQMRLEMELIAIREKKARQIALINGISSTVSSFGGGGGSQSIGQIFASLQGFETGTEAEIGNYIKPNLKGVGIDNIAVRVHKDERIINGDLSRKIQGHKTSDVVNGYVQYHQMIANNAIGNNIDLSETNSLLKKQLEQKPVEYNISKVVSGSFDIIRSSQKGNTLEKKITRIRI